MEKGSECKKDNNVSNIRGIEAQTVTAHTINVSIGQVSAQPTQENYVHSFRTVDAPVAFFTGRTELLKAVHQKLQERLHEKHFMRRIVALVGMGGMGKTEIARKLVDDYRDHYQNVAWIDAETETSIRESFLKIADSLKLPRTAHRAKSKDLDDLVYRHISQHVKTTTLFIFDNASQLKTEGDIHGIFDDLPSQVTSGIPLILLTSRMTEWGKDSCEVIHVPELTPAESWACLRSRFAVSPVAIRNDSVLRALMEELNGKLNGYPLALGLAVANISFSPGRDSFQLLKQGLNKYIQCIDGNEFLEHRLDANIGASYPHTPLEMWAITMANLERRKYGKEAEFLLSILAHCSQQEFLVDYAREMYEVRNSGFGLTYPGKDNASFEEALHALQALDLVKSGKYQEHDEAIMIKVRPIVQQLSIWANSYEESVQKILLYNLKGTEYLFMTCRHFVHVNEEFLWSHKGIPRWALKSSRKLVLWLHGFRYLRRPHEGEPAQENWTKCKKQLGKQKYGKDIVRVGDFILSSRFLDQCDDSEGGLPFRCPWTVLANALQVRRSLNKRSKVTRVFLELLLLSVVADSFASTLRNLMTKEGTDELLTQLWKLPSSSSSSSMSQAFAEWLSDFEFSTVVTVFDDYEQIEHVLRVMIQDQLYCFIRKPEQAAELVQDHRLLDYLSQVLKTCSDDYISAALGIIQKLAFDPMYVHLVVHHVKLMDSLELVSLLRRLEPIPTGGQSFGRFRSDEQIRKGFPLVEQEVIAPDWGLAHTTATVYGLVVVQFAINTVVAESPYHSGALLTSARKLLAAEGCKAALSFFAQLDFTGAELEVEECDWYEVYDWDSPLVTKHELEQDKIMLNSAREMFKGKDRNEFLIPLLGKVQECNDFLLSVFSEPATQDSDEDSSTEEEDPVDNDSRN